MFNKEFLLNPKSKFHLIAKVNFESTLLKLNISIFLVIIFTLQWIGNDKNKKNFCCIMNFMNWKSVDGDEETEETKYEASLHKKRIYR